MFLGAKGLMVVSIVEIYQEFKNPSLTSTTVSTFSEFSLEHGYRRKSERRSQKHKNVNKITNNVVTNTLLLSKCKE